MLSQLLAERVVILRYVQPAKFLQRQDGEVQGTLSDGNWIEKRLRASYYAYNIIHQFYKYNTATHVQQKQKKSLLFQAVHAFGNRTLLILSGLIPGRVPWRLQSSNAYPEAWIVKIRRKMFRWEYQDEQQDKRGREREDKRGRERRQGLGELGLLSVRVIGHQKTAPLIGHYLPFPSIYLSLLYFLFSAAAIFAKLNFLVPFNACSWAVSFRLIVWISNYSGKLLSPALFLLFFVQDAYLSWKLIYLLIIAAFISHFGFLKDKEEWRSGSYPQWAFYRFIPLVTRYIKRNPS